jgi:DNA-binding NarL/FixJ family response regulator
LRKEGVVTRLILADDHRLVREGLRLILEARGDLRVVAEAGDGEEAVRAVREHKPDIALIDLTMPRVSGSDAIRRIHRERDTRCIVVSMHEELGFVTQALEAGASGYVVKSASSTELFEAIDAVRSGRSYLSPSIAHWAVEAIAHASARPSSRLRGLTPREREVLRLIAEGLSSKEIAAALRVSAKTVEAHRARLMAKLKVHRASGLVRVALQEGLLSL